MTPPPRRQVARMGVVGLGYWGPNLVRNVVDAPRAELAWLCDANPRALLPLGRRYPTARRTADFSEMLADPDLDASELTVAVKNCEVTLEGTVDDHWAKRRAEDCAEEVSGVNQVHNRLQVRPAGGASGSGARTTQG